MPNRAALVVCVLNQQTLFTPEHIMYCVPIIPSYIMRLRSAQYYAGVWSYSTHQAITAAVALHQFTTLSGELITSKQSQP